MRLVFALFYLFLVVLTIPLAFELGGVECGLAYLLILLVIYFALTSLTYLTNNRFWFVEVAYYVQHLCVPLVLLLVVASYTGNHALLPFLVWSRGSTSDSSLATVLGIQTQAFHYGLSVWRSGISHATPVFTTMEGLSTLLAIQAIGQMARWMLRHRSDLYLMAALLASSVVITTLLYFLYELYALSGELRNAITVFQALLLGSIFTYTGVLGIYGIVSRRGSALELLLLFAYIVRCVYEIFPEILRDVLATLSALIGAALVHVRDNGYTHLSQFYQLLPATNETFARLQAIALQVTHNYWTLFVAILDFCKTTLHNISPLILLNLVYRTSVFYAATRIVPLVLLANAALPSISAAILPVHLSLLLSSARLSPLPAAPRKQAPKQLWLVLVLYAYLPCIVILVYTHLMMQHYEATARQQLQLWPPAIPVPAIARMFDQEQVILVNAMQFWQWTNIVFTLVVYTGELIGGDEGSQVIDNHMIE